ncbi:MAG: hypothetical protein QNJ81_07165 [Acidimicrobiia bacterium]|nr:hypothetical protein [Acidimicrobiia bacterium]
MKLYAMCRICGRSLAGAHGRCRMCLLRQIPQRRVREKPTAIKKLR